MANKLKFFIVGDDKEAQAALDRVDKKVQDVTSAFAKWGVAMSAATAAFSIKEATEFETKMAEVSTLLDDTSGLEGMEQAVKDLAITYGQFPDDQVASLYSIISAGAESSAEAIQTLEAANRLAIGGVTEVAIAADGLTSALNAYGEEAGTVVDVSDAMFVAMKAGKTTIGELSGSLGNVAPIAAEAGVSLDELLGATAALTKTGATTSVSMNGLRQVISSVLKPTSEAQKEAKLLGIEFNSAALQSQGLQGFLENLKKATGGNKDSLTQLFGSVEALGPVFALTGSQAGAFSEIMADMENKAGATDAAFSKMDETGGQAFARLKATGEVLAITMGNELLPAVADLANFLIGPTTAGINKVEEAFFFLKTSAFAVMGGISDAVLAIIAPLAKAQGFLNNLLGIKVPTDNAFIAMASDLEMFSAAMEEGALETFKARDATEQHNIELRKQSDALRGITEAITETSATKDEAIAQDIERDESEKVRKSEVRTLEQEAEREHQAALIKEVEDGQKAQARFLALTTGEKVKTTLKGGADTLASVSQTNKSVFELHKGLALASAAVSLPSSVLQSFENGGGYPWGLIPAGLMLVRGLSEIQAISGSSYTGQAHAGTDRVAQDQTALLKQGEMVLDPGTSEAVRQQVTGGGNGGGGVSVVIENFIINIHAGLGAAGINWQKVVAEQIKPEIDALFRRDVFLKGVAYV